MTAEGLIQHLNREFGNYEQWPETYKVNYETFANCCQFIFNFKSTKQGIIDHKILVTTVLLGRHMGPKFKNVELILDPTGI